MLRNRANWRRRMNDILKEKNISLESILDMNEKLYDNEVRQLVYWLLDQENCNVNEQDIYKQINIIRK
jgi:hypothetical protein